MLSLEVISSNLVFDILVEKVTLQNSVGTSFHHANENACNNVRDDKDAYGGVVGLLDDLVLGY